MRKLSVLAVMTAAAIAGSTALPAQAADTNVRTKAVTSKNVTVIQGKDLNDLKDKLNEKLNGFEGSMGDIYWQVCPPEVILPDGNTPDQPGPDVPGGNVPDSDQPGTDAPDNNVPDADQPGPDSHDRTFAQQVVDLVNAERVKAGLMTLTVDEKIEAAALVRAKETEVSFSHTRPNGTSFSTALTEQGVSYRGSGENIAWGQRTPQEVMTGWMNSDGHRANILNPKFTKIGVGYYQNAAGRNYWTQLFTY